MLRDFLTRWQERRAERAKQRALNRELADQEWRERLEYSRRRTNRREVQRVASPDGTREAVLYQVGTDTLHIGMVGAKGKLDGVVSVIAFRHCLNPDHLTFKWIDNASIEILHDCNEQSVDSEQVIMNADGKVRIAVPKPLKN